MSEKRDELNELMEDLVTIHLFKEEIKEILASDDARKTFFIRLQEYINK